ncbi:MAG: hypothetical protein AAGA48_00800 [Myxococcota bacterium]
MHPAQFGISALDTGAGFNQRVDSHGLLCPWPSRVHSNTTTAAAHTLSWLDEHGMLENDRLATESYSWLAGRMFPSADANIFQLLSDFTSWIFDHDDVVDESDLRADPSAMRRLFDHEFRLFQGQVAPQKPNEEALCDLGRRFQQAAASSVWFTRFALSFRAYLNGCLWEGENRATRHAPSVDEYVSLRPFAGAVWLYLDLMELVLSRPPIQVTENRKIRELRRCSADLAAWHNDIYSVGKELRAKDPHNLVLVIQREQDVELSAAVSQAVERSNDRVRTFTKLASSFKSRDALRYIEALRDFVGGAFDYLLESSRYRSFSEEQALSG